MPNRIKDFPQLTELDEDAGALLQPQSDYDGYVEVSDLRRIIKGKTLEVTGSIAVDLSTYKADLNIRFNGTADSTITFSNSLSESMVLNVFNDDVAFNVVLAGSVVGFIPPGKLSSSIGESGSMRPIESIGIIQSGDNLNNVNREGNYYAVSGVINIPYSASFHIVHAYRGATSSVQRAYEIDGDNAFFRTNNSGTWSPWIHTGGRTVTATDCNLLTVPGIYYVATTGSNKPTTGDAFFIRVETNGSNTIQYAYCITTRASTFMRLSPTAEWVTTSSNYLGFDNNGRHEKYTGDIDTISSNSLFNVEVQYASGDQPFVSRWYFLDTKMHEFTPRFSTQVAYPMYSPEGGSQLKYRTKESDLWSPWYLIGGQDAEDKAITDLDDLDESGAYKYDSGAASAPYSSKNALVQSLRNSTRKAQIAIPEGTDPKTFTLAFRDAVGSTWQPWLYTASAIVSNKSVTIPAGSTSAEINDLIDAVARTSNGYTTTITFEAGTYTGLDSIVGTGFGMGILNFRGQPADLVKSATKSVKLVFNDGEGLRFSNNGGIVSIAGIEIDYTGHTTISDQCLNVKNCFFEVQYCAFTGTAATNFSSLVFESSIGIVADSYISDIYKGAISLESSEVAIDNVTFDNTVYDGDAQGGKIIWHKIVTTTDISQSLGGIHTDSNGVVNIPKSITSLTDSNITAIKSTGRVVDFLMPSTATDNPCGLDGHVTARSFVGSDQVDLEYKSGDKGYRCSVYPGTATPTTAWTLYPAGQVFITSAGTESDLFNVMSPYLGLTANGVQCITSGFGLNNFLIVHAARINTTTIRIYIKTATSAPQTYDIVSGSGDSIERTLISW